VSEAIKRLRKKKKNNRCKKKKKKKKKKKTTEKFLRGHFPIRRGAVILRTEEKVRKGRSTKTLFKRAPRYRKGQCGHRLRKMREKQG